MNLTDKIGEGSQADIYLYRGYAYKVFRTEKKKAEAFYEAAVVTTVENLGLSIAKVYEVFTYNQQPVIKMEFIKGVDMNKLMIRNPQNLSLYIKKLISLQINVHTKAAGLPLSLKHQLKARITATDKLSVGQKDRHIDYLNRLPDGESLCHGDFHGGNILGSGNNYTIIDWADATVGNKYGDVCRTYMLYSFYYPEIAELYLRMYCEYTDSDRRTVLEWLPVVAAARLIDNNQWEREQIFSWTL